MNNAMAFEDENEKAGQDVQAGKNAEATKPGSQEAESPPPASVPDEHHAHKKSSDHDEAKSLKAKIKKKDHEVKDLKAEVEALKDRYLRAAAEMDNQRKRLERDKDEFFQYALASLLRDILSILDNFERALKNRETTDAQVFQSGVELIAKQIQDVLRRRGVTEVEADGRPFDPTVHQAVVTEESPDVTEPHVGEVLQKGYRLNDRLLRPALVKVIVPIKDGE
jgi:molecular chaperone GrpE